MTVVGEGTVPISADVDGLDKGIDKGLGKADGKIGSWAKGAAKVIGGAMIAGFALDFAGDAISSASDLNETVSKSRTIFGDAGGAIEKWASGAADNIGQSKGAALDAAATFGNLFVQLGIGSDQAAGMSTAMVELASDFASFHNANPAEVIEAQTAAFRGEYDALQRFVPTINAAAVEQKALAMSGKATTAELTAQEKALATQALMMEGAGAAAGDFARTSDGLANQQRIQSAQWEDMTAKIGQGLIPIMAAAVSFITGTLIPGIGSIVSFFQTTVMPGLEAAGAWLLGLWQQIAQWTKTNWASIREVVEHVLNVLKGAWRLFGDDLLRVAKVIWSTIQAYIKAVLDLIRSVIQTAMSIINGDWGKAWAGIKGIAAAVWDGIKALVTGAIGVIKGLMGGIASVVGAGWSAAWAKLKEMAGDAVAGVVGFVRDLPGKVLGYVGAIGAAFGAIGNAAVGSLGRALSGAAGIAGDIAGAVGRAVRGAINSVIDMLNSGIPNSLGAGPFRIDLPDNPIPRLHSGGVVTRSMPTYAGLGANERPAILEVGEVVVPRGGSVEGGRGITVNVRTDRLDLNRELRRARLLAPAV